MARGYKQSLVKDAIPAQLVESMQLVFEKGLKVTLRQRVAEDEKLAAEIIDGYNKVGSSMTTRENVHKMAEANKAFAYYA